MNRFLKLTNMILINRIIVVDNELDSKICETKNYILLGIAKQTFVPWIKYLNLEPYFYKSLK